MTLTRVVNPRSATIKARLQRPRDPVIAFMAPNTIAARMLESLGCELLVVGAGGVIGPITGRTDDGSITMSESVQISRWFADAVDMPVWTDTDACWGGAVQAERAVEEFIRAGVSVITMEDQPLQTKRFGGSDGKRVIPVEEMVEKLRVASAVRDDLDPNFQIVARCDALEATNAKGLPEAIERLQAYRQAGADVAYLEAPRTWDELATARAALPGPFRCTDFKLPRELTYEDGVEHNLCMISRLRVPTLIWRLHYLVYETVTVRGLEGLREIEKAIDHLVSDRGRPADGSLLADLRWKIDWLPYGDRTRRRTDNRTERENS